MECPKCKCSDGTALLEQQDALRSYRCSRCNDVHKTVEVDSSYINQLRAAQFLAERETAYLRREIESMRKGVPAAAEQRELELMPQQAVLVGPFNPVTPAVVSAPVSLVVPGTWPHSWDHG